MVLGVEVSLTGRIEICGVKSFVVGWVELETSVLVLSLVTVDRMTGVTDDEGADPVEFVVGWVDPVVFVVVRMDPVVFVVVCAISVVDSVKITHKSDIHDTNKHTVGSDIRNAFK